MPLPEGSEYKVPLLLELERAGGTLRPADTYEPVRAHFRPGFISESDRKEQNNSGKNRYENHVQGEAEHLKRGGFVTRTSGGIWPITPRGKDEVRRLLVDTHGVQPGEVDRVIGSNRKLYQIDPSWTPEVSRVSGTSPAQASLPPQRAAPPPPPSAPPVAPPHVSPSPDVSTQLQPETIDETKSIREEILTRLNRMNDRQFEDFVGRLLTELGYHDVDVVGRSGDGGVDVRCVLKGPLIEPPLTVVCQVKRHASNIGPSAVGDLRGRWAHRADRLILINTAGFTQGAREAATESGAKEISLVSGEDLADLMIEKGIGVRKEPVVKERLDEGFFDEFSS